MRESRIVLLVVGFCVSVVALSLLTASRTPPESSEDDWRTVSVSEKESNTLDCDDELNELEKRISRLEMSCGSDDSSELFLIVAIPTIVRENKNYLLPVVKEYIRQLNMMDSLLGRIGILIIDNSPKGQNVDVSEINDFAKNHPKVPVLFHRNDGEIHKNHEDETDSGGPNVPGARVRRQTRDLAYLLRKSSTYSTDHVLLSEDDFVPCENSMRAVVYMIEKATNYVTDWLTLRVAYGGSGIVFKRKDLNEVSTYLVNNVQRRPPDHLLIEWLGKETQERCVALILLLSEIIHLFLSKVYCKGRQHFTFRYNLFNHIGQYSSLRTPTHVIQDTCYSEHMMTSFFGCESFKRNECPQDDIWPCSMKPSNYPSRIEWYKKS